MTSTFASKWKNLVPRITAGIRQRLPQGYGPPKRLTRRPRTRRHFASQQSVPVGVLRRSRKKYGKYDSPQLGTQIPMAGMEEPLEYSGDNLDEYTEKATLSPWTPVPDSVARKIFDTADPTSEDVHVELGSGDGRVNFFAIDAGVHRSVGIDVDEAIVKVANDRLNRIHPKPNLEFMTTDLMTADSPAWEEVEQATILTMYFAKEGMEKIRPLIERSLRGKRCKIFACGYPMPSWDPQMIETVLDMPIHFYDWGNKDVEDTFLAPDSSLPDNFGTQNVGMDKFASRKKKSTFRPDPLLGLDPRDLVDYGWDDFEDSHQTAETKDDASKYIMTGSK